MGRAVVMLWAAALTWAVVLGRSDDDFAFESNEEFQVELTANHSEITRNGLKKLWGVPDTTAYAEHLFRMEIPKEAFTGKVSAYKVRGENGSPLPSWLAVDSRHGLVTGVPQAHDVGVHVFEVTAHGTTHGLTASDSFSVEVKRSSDKTFSKYGSCSGQQKRLVAVVVLDRPLGRITPKQRIQALMGIARFMALDGDEFRMSPYNPSRGRVVTGGGDFRRRRDDNQGFTGIYWTVGCGSTIWPQHKVLVSGLREESRDGTLASVVGGRVAGWRLVAEEPAVRYKRQSSVGSGDYDNYDGDGDDDYSGDYDNDDDTDDEYTRIDLPDNNHNVQITPYSESASEANSAIVNMTALPEDISPRRLNELDAPIVIVPEEMTTSTEAEETPTSTERTSTIIGRTTETVTFAMPVNQPPTLNHHMKKLAITAGKAFRYIIPADLFTDPEEGTNLTFTMYENDNTPLSQDSWIQFTPAEREVYGLPLESHVSRWHFSVEARDGGGLSARGPLDVTVQQHRRHRTVNHQFVLQFRLPPHYPSIDWQIRALEGIVNLFRDTDMEHLTVLNATRRGDAAEFVWTNDTLPRDGDCPMDDIKRLMAILSGGAGSPSPGLVRAMAPLEVTSVSSIGTGPCADIKNKTTGTFPPVARNQVDHITATAGQLLTYKVQEDTFYDPEDGNTRHLALSLLRGDRSPLPPTHWLQFDHNNQEFYGLPLPGDEGAQHYQLIAEDSTKKSTYDSLIVEVVKAPTIRPTVEFQMTMEYQYDNLANNAPNKRKVVEKLAKLFGEQSTDSIRVKSITDHPTTIIWYNTSLPMDHCPKKDIESLHHRIISGHAPGDTSLTPEVDQIFDKDFKVMSIRLVPLGLCAEHGSKVKPAPPPPPRPPAQSAGDLSQYLTTYIVPAVIVACMLVAAALIACLLYRRRRTGKMSVGDEEERQAFRSKGIPVIFQDELEERTDSEPVHKSPVIMREEKPPLLPPAPEYRGGEDAPYRPPPPFASSRPSPRPKPTPTYRKPPPYVPP